MSSLLAATPRARAPHAPRPLHAQLASLSVRAPPAPRPAPSCAAVPTELPPFAKRRGATYLSTSEKYAIIDVGGVQHLVEEGRWYTCNRMKAAPGDVVQFGRVLALKSDGEFHLGTPYVEGCAVEAQVVEELKGPKVLIYKMKPKKHTRKKVGHRQPLSKCAPPARACPALASTGAHRRTLRRYVHKHADMRAAWSTDVPVGRMTARR